MKIIESHLRACACLELKEEELHLWQWCTLKKRCAKVTHLLCPENNTP